MTRSLERGYMPAVSWGALFAGFLFALGVAVLFYLFGAAIGVTTMAAMNEFQTGVAIGTGIWMLLSWVVALFAGGWLAGRLAGRTDHGIGAMHGMVVWALSGVMTFLTLWMPFSSMVTGGARMGGQLGGAVGQASLQVPPEIQEALRQQIAEQIAATAPDVTPQEAQRASQQLTQQDINDIAASIVSGQPEQARSILANRTSLTEQEISQVVSGTGEGMRDRLGGVAEQAGDFASVGLWVWFLTSLLGLAAAIWGGMIGARRAELFLEHVAEDDPYLERERRSEHVPAPAR